MDFWLCDLQQALNCIKEKYGDLGIVVTKIEPSINGRGIVFTTTSHNFIVWDRSSDNCYTIKS